MLANNQANTDGTVKPPLVSPPIKWNKGSQLEVPLDRKTAKAISLLFNAFDPHYVTKIIDYLYEAQPNPGLLTAGMTCQLHNPDVQIRMRAANFLTKACCGNIAAAPMLFCASDCENDTDVKTVLRWAGIAAAGGNYNFDHLIASHKSANRFSKLQDLAESRDCSLAAIVLTKDPDNICMTLARRSISYMMAKNAPGITEVVRLTAAYVLSGDISQGYHRQSHLLSLLDRRPNLVQEFQPLLHKFEASPHVFLRLKSAMLDIKHLRNEDPQTVEIITRALACHDEDMHSLNDDNFSGSSGYEFDSDDLNRRIAAATWQTYEQAVLPSENSLQASYDNFIHGLNVVKELMLMKQEVKTEIVEEIYDRKIAALNRRLVFPQICEIIYGNISHLPETAAARIRENYYSELESDPREDIRNGLLTGMEFVFPDDTEVDRRLKHCLEIEKNASVRRHIEHTMDRIAKFREMELRLRTSDRGR